jgi:uncharacterized protein involved in exopolysaccharide biosynthesis
MGLDATSPSLDEISFRELILVVRRSKWLVLGVTAAFAAAAVILVLIFPKSYEATLVVSPVSGDSQNGMSGGLSSAASQFSGLASLVGISTTADTKKFETLAVLKSQDLTRQYISENNLLPILYPKRWDAVNRRWKPGEKIPTLWTANLMFSDKIRAITTDSKTGLSTLSITWSDPATAARWANDLVKMTNDYLRNQAIRQGELNISYLTEEAAKTDEIGVRQAIYSILQNEISKVMLARGSEEYALKVVDHAYPPERPSNPKPILWVCIGTLVGLVVSFTIIVLRKPVKP